MKNMKSIAIGAALFTAGTGVGCGDDDNTGPTSYQVFDVRPEAVTIPSATSE